ncbi:MAG: hydroxymethylbilane synthase [Candidatus Acidiferrales bacterium]
MKSLRIGSRGSALALWQANHIRQRLRESCGVGSEIVTIRTSGDRLEQAPIGQIGLKGVFIKEIEDALFGRRADLAVHSMKDVPTEIPAGLVFPAITKREDVRDCLVSRGGKKLAELAPGARVGTSSLRRQAQLRHYRPDLELRDLRGNVDTRLRKLDAGEFDAIVLAKAGIERLGQGAKISETISPEVMLPAVGQGALGIECRSDEKEVFGLLQKFDDNETRAAVTAERALLSELEGGCQVPLGAWGRIENQKLILEAAVLSADGAECLRRKSSGDVAEAAEVGRRLAQELIDAGADRILRLAGRTLGKR